MSPVKTVESVEMPFGMWTLGPMEPLLGGGPDPPWEGAILGLYLACPDLPVVDILTLFTRGQERYGLWLPVCCSNLLLPSSLFHLTCRRVVMCIGNDCWHMMCSNAFGLTTTGALMMLRRMYCYSARIRRRTTSKDHWSVLAFVISVICCY